MSSPAFSEPHSSWSHNGSLVTLHIEGDELSITYGEPKKEILDAGVSPGDILFSGSRSGKRISGKARAFSKRCGVFTYPVTGYMTADNRRIVMTGNEPTHVSKGCKPTYSSLATLSFELVEALKPAPQVAAPNLEAGPKLELRGKAREDLAARERLGQQAALERERREAEEAAQRAEREARERRDREENNREIQRQKEAVDAERQRLAQLAETLQREKVAVEAGRQAAERQSKAERERLAGERERDAAKAAARVETSTISPKNPDPTWTKTAAFFSGLRSTGGGQVSLALVAALLMGVGVAFYFSRRGGARAARHNEPTLERGGGGDTALAATATIPLAKTSPAPSIKPTRGAEPYKTAAAVEAMELAHSYLEELTGKETHSDSMEAKDALTSLALVTKQIKIAESYDPTAVLTIERDGETATFTLAELKANALFHETFARIGIGEQAKALRCIQQAINLSPDNAGFYNLLGTIYVTHNQKRKAIEAFEKAVALAPREIEIRKALDRARNMSGAAIAIKNIADAGRSAWRVAQFIPLLIMIGIVVALIANFGYEKVLPWIFFIIVLPYVLKIANWIQNVGR